MLSRQMGKGKGDAIRLGSAKTTGGILMIFDARKPPHFLEEPSRATGYFMNTAFQIPARI